MKDKDTGVESQI